MSSKGCAPFGPSLCPAFILSLAFLLCGALSAVAAAQQPGGPRDFAAWAERHGRQYSSPAERAKREAVYRANLAWVEAENERHR